MTNSDITAAYYDVNPVSKIYLGSELVWPTTLPDPYLSMPLTFEILSAGTISATTGMSLEYSINDGEWTTYADAELNLQQGDILKLRGNNATAPHFDGTAYFNAYGNAYSVLRATGFANITELTVTGACAYMFASFVGINIVSAENLKLPATTLTDGCYEGMFQMCTALTTSPELPATTLAINCYGGMFAGCSSLTTAPVLPATTLAENCYSGMFNGCSSLTTAPALPATTLAYSCYGGMFNVCTSLTTAPALPATTLSQSCYNNMFYGCTSLTTAPVLPATTLAINCYGGMFQNCTSLTAAPELPATTLVNDCYRSMFYKCNRLNYIKCLATDISASDCTRYWVRNIASTGTFVKNPNMAGWTTGNNGIPTGWTVQDATI